jgi:dCMP deaminase
MYQPRKKVPWHTYFMDIAEVVKTRSMDPKLQVGAVLVSLKDNRIISTGYNSVCANMDDSNVDWSNREHVKTIVVHAETNAVLYAQSKFEDSILYTTTSPCMGCLKLLSATKIKKVVYKREYSDFDQVKNLCNYFKIELIKYKTNQTN